MNFKHILRTNVKYWNRVIRRNIDIKIVNNYLFSIFGKKSVIRNVLIIFIVKTCINENIQCKIK
jgi:hypothetical protein